MNIEDARTTVEKQGYKVEILGLAPQLWAGEEPESYVVFWRATEKQPGGQYTLCVIKDGKVEHKGNYEERSEAQEQFCRLVFPYQD